MITRIVSAFCDVQTEYIYFKLLKVFGSILVPAISHQPVTMGACVHSQASPCEMFDGQSGTYLTTIAPYSSSAYFFFYHDIGVKPWNH